MLQKGKNRLKSKAFAKLLTKHVVKSLVNGNADSPLKKGYWRSFNCAETLYQNGKNLTSRYCNARWCVVCNRIRTAKLINGYHETLSNLEQPFFVTLTVPNVDSDYLDITLEQLKNRFRYIQQQYRRKFKGTHFPPLMGIRKVECTYNIERNDYHPHLHLIVNNYHQALFITSYWLQVFKEAVPYAQDLREANEGSILELFKYFTKIAVKGLDGQFTIASQPLDTIFQAFYKKRVFQPFGIKKDVDEDIENDLEAQEYEELADKMDIWHYQEHVYDWVNSDLELLTNYEPQEKMLKILENINSTLHTEIN